MALPKSASHAVVAPDGCSVVTIALFFISFVVDGIAFSYPTLVATFANNGSEILYSTATAHMFIAAIMMSVYQLAAPFPYWLVTTRGYNHRTIIITGAVLSSLGLIWSATQVLSIVGAPEYVDFFIGYGLFTGLGCCFMSYGANCALHCYYCANRQLASIFSSTLGSSCGIAVASITFLNLEPTSVFHEVLSYMSYATLQLIWIGALVWPLPPPPELADHRNSCSTLNALPPARPKNHCDSIRLCFEAFCGFGAQLLASDEATVAVAENHRKKRLELLNRRGSNRSSLASVERDLVEAIHDQEWRSLSRIGDRDNIDEIPHSSKQLMVLSPPAPTTPAYACDHQTLLIRPEKSSRSLDYSPPHPQEEGSEWQSLIEWRRQHLASPAPPPHEDSLSDVANGGGSSSSPTMSVGREAGTMKLSDFVADSISWLPGAVSTLFIELLLATSFYLVFFTIIWKSEDIAFAHIYQLLRRKASEGNELYEQCFRSVKRRDEIMSAFFNISSYDVFPRNQTLIVQFFLFASQAEGCKLIDTQDTQHIILILAFAISQVVGRLFVCCVTSMSSLKSKMMAMGCAIGICVITSLSAIFGDSILQPATLFVIYLFVFLLFSIAFGLSEVNSTLSDDGGEDCCRIEKRRTFSVCKMFVHGLGPVASQGALYSVQRFAPLVEQHIFQRPFVSFNQENYMLHSVFIGILWRLKCNANNSVCGVAALIYLLQRTCGPRRGPSRCVRPQLTPPPTSL